MWGRKRIGVAALAFVLTVLLLPLGTISAQPRKGPAVDEIIVETRATGEVAVGDVATGRLDFYAKSLAPTVYEGLPEYLKENLRLIPNAGGTWEITLNPYYEEGTPYLVNVEGKTYFNPFAIRKVRFAMNYLINRKYLVDEVLKGGGEVAYSPISPSHPAYKYFEDIFKNWGFTPEGNEELALQMIDEALTEAAEQLGGRLKKVPDPRSPAGYWWTFDGEPVTVKFFIRIEDERHEEGLYVASQIEKAGIKVERIEANFLKCIYTVYFSNPADYEWNLYTAGWGATAASPFVEGDLAWYYTPIFGWMPAYQMAGWWEWQNETIDELIQDLIFMNVASPEEYWEKARKVMEIGVSESIRVFTAVTVDYFPVNKERVTKIGYDAVTGLWSFWPWRTVETVDGKLRVAVEAQQAQMYTSAWNPLGGLDDVYSHLIARATYDQGVARHPTTAEYMPVRASWELQIDYTLDEEGNKVGNIDVPSDAVVYDSAKNEWIPVGSGQKAIVKAVIKYKFSNWHHGIPMTLDDVKYAIAFAYEWSHEDEEGDPYYHPEYASGMAPQLEYYKGFQFVEPDTLIVYGDYLHIVSENETASFYVWWPTLPWEVYEAASYVIANGGPVSGNEYSWYKEEGKEYLDLISPAHLVDLRAAIEELRLEGHVPDALKGSITPTQAVERYNAVLRFMDQYGTAWISNGPFVLVKYDPQKMYMRLVAFRDPTYPFTEDYWVNKFFVVRERVESINAPTSITAGDSIDVTASVIESQEYPEVKEYPAEEAYVAVRLKDSAGNIVYETEMSMVAPGQFKATIPGSVTEGKEGAFTIEVLAGKTSTLVTGTSSVDIIITAPAPPPTTEAPTTAPPTTTAPPATTTAPPPTTAPPAGPNWTLIGGVIVLIVIVVAALFLTKKKSAE